MGCCGSSNLDERSVATSSEIPRPQDSNSPAPRPYSPKKEKKSPQGTPMKPIKSKSASTSEQKETVNLKDSKENSKSATLSWNLDADMPDQRKAEFQLKMSEKKSQIEEDAKQLAFLKDKAFEIQVARQQKVESIYEVFKHYATNQDKTKMDIDGCTEALKSFGMIIDTSKELKKLVFSKFDIEDEGEIDYNDFMATMSSLIGTKNEDTLMLMFQIFDIDEDGYLVTDDIARILLSQNQIALSVTGKSNECNKRTLNRRECLKLARHIITKYDSDDFSDNKISFDEFVTMMINTTTEEMVIDNMPSLSSVMRMHTPDI